jgi:hypothetical protein
MVLKMIRGGGWSGRAVTQQRPRVSKLGIKGLSDYHSNEIAVKAARQEANEPNEKGYLHGIKIELDNSSTVSLTEQGQKDSPPEKNTTIERATYSIYG